MIEEKKLKQNIYPLLNKKKKLEQGAFLIENPINN